MKAGLTATFLKCCNISFVYGCQDIEILFAFLPAGSTAPACLPVCLPVRVPFLPVCLTACLPVWLASCLSVCLCLCLCVCVSVCLSACVGVCLSFCGLLACSSSSSASSFSSLCNCLLVLLIPCRATVDYSIALLMPPGRRCRCNGGSLCGWSPLLFSFLSLLVSLSVSFSLLRLPGSLVFLPQPPHAQRQKNKVLQATVHKAYIKQL